jgi:hypothetical protein
MNSKFLSFLKRKSIFELSAFSVLLGWAILFSVKPWRAYFYDGLPANHWDPQLMDTWMAWNAHNILRGHFLIPDYHINFFYPHSYVLAFSELLWPQSFVYALSYVLTGNHFFCFNACMLFFWTLSGVLMYVLLRSLDISRIVSALGGFIYCLMPFRMPYYLEFNMQLVFIFPLLLLVSLHWLKNPSWRNSLWFCFCYFLAATSCIYYTLMAIVMMAFVFIAFLAGNTALFRQRTFYVSSVLLLVGCLSVTAIYLHPYALLRIQGGYQRSMADYLHYFAQPMQYLDTQWSVFLKWLKLPQPSFAETHLFPGTVLCLLTLLFLVYDSVHFCRNYKAVPKIGRWIAAAKAILWLFFWTAILVNTFWEKELWLVSAEPYLHPAAFALIGLYLAGLFFLTDKERASDKLLAALSAAAVLCFFISCGPFISTGPDKNILQLAHGIFADLLAWNPLFGAVRVLTRFSIVILTYLVIAGCFAFNRLALRQKHILWLAPALILMVFYEAREMRPACEFTRSFPDPARSKVLHAAYNLPGNNVFFQLPIGMRTVDANVVMSTIGKFSLIVDGLSGFIPDFYGKLWHWEENQWRVDNMLDWAGDVWPTPYVIIDRPSVFFLEAGWHKPFPWETLKQYGDLIEEDDVYSLYRPKQQISSEERIIRYIRTDLLKVNRLLTFKARHTDASPCSLSVSLNHHPVSAGIPLTGTAETWQEYKIPLPLQEMGNVKGEEVEIRLSAAAPAAPRHWQIKEIDFRAVQ